MNSFLFLSSVSFSGRSQPLKSHVRAYSPLDTNESEWQISQIGLQFLVTHEHFASGKLKIRCSASIYDVYWQSTEVSAEEDRPRVIHYEPAATIVGINYLQPPPNFQTGQKKPDGQVGVKGNDNVRPVSTSLRARCVSRFRPVAARNSGLETKTRRFIRRVKSEITERRREGRGRRGLLTLFSSCSSDVWNGPRFPS